LLAKNGASLCEHLAFPPRPILLYLKQYSNIETKKFDLKLQGHLVVIATHDEAKRFSDFTNVL
jgi:hypothetical protein